MLPVTFRQAQARDALHGAGVYTAVVDAAFAEDTDCVLIPSVGEPAAIRVRATDRAPLPGDPVIPGPATIVVGTPGEVVKAGTWVPLRLRGFQPGYVDIRIDGTTVYAVRAGADGRFERTGVIPATTYDGRSTISAVQGVRSASTVVEVESPLKPLPDVIDQSAVKVHDVDSEETVGEDGRAVNAVDGNSDTIWHTDWYSIDAPFPHPTSPLTSAASTTSPAFSTFSARTRATDGSRTTGSPCPRTA